MHTNKYLEKIAKQSDFHPADQMAGAVIGSLSGYGAHKLVTNPNLKLPLAIAGALSGAASGGELSKSLRKKFLGHKK